MVSQLPKRARKVQCFRSLKSLRGSVTLIMAEYAIAQSTLKDIMNAVDKLKKYVTDFVKVFRSEAKPCSEVEH